MQLKNIFYAVKDYFNLKNHTSLTGNSETGTDPARTGLIFMHHLNQHKKLFQLLFIWILVSAPKRQFFPVGAKNLNKTSYTFITRIVREFSDKCKLVIIRTY